MATQKTVLIVDDVVYARKILKEILTTHAYSVVGEAANGREAMIAYKTYQPDLVIMDLIMPVVGGIEATRGILEEDKEAKIIIVSSVVHEQFLMEAINAGARDFIVKPFSADDIITAIEKLFFETSDSSSGAVAGKKMAVRMK